MSKSITVTQHNELKALGYKGGRIIDDMIKFLGGYEDFNNLKRAHELWITSGNYTDALWEAVKEILEE